MTALAWDTVGQRFYETGVDHGVLYIPDSEGTYNLGYSWSGLTTVTESPSGAESNAQYADNIKYLNLLSAEVFGGTIEAFTFPDEFMQCDGTAEPTPGMSMGQQSRKTFGLCYRTRKGNDIDGADHGYKLHLVYGAQASPSERAYGTINDSPEAINFSWQFSTTPIPVGTVNSVAYKPTSLIVLDSTQTDPTALAALELVLYGTTGVDPLLPTPAAIYAALSAAVTTVRLTGANAPTYDSGTHVVTLPSVTGVTWKINGVTATAGAQTAMTTGQTSLVTAVANVSYQITGDSDWVFDY